jgi:hypothetical protein
MQLVVLEHVLPVLVAPAADAAVVLAVGDLQFQLELQATRLVVVVEGAGPHVLEAGRALSVASLFLLTLNPVACYYINIVIFLYIFIKISFCYSEILTFLLQSL